DLLAQAQVEGADRAGYLDVVGNDVEADAAMDRAEGDNRRQLRQVGATADDGLRGADHVGRGDDRIDAAPWPRAVRLPAVHLDGEAVGRRQHRSLAHADLPGLQGGEHVQAEDRVRLEGLEYAFLEH